MAGQSAAEILKEIQQLTKETGDLKTHLAIVRISEPISSAADLANSNASPSKRGSDVSTLDNPTPATLDADLTHYKVRTSRFRMRREIEPLIKLFRSGTLREIALFVH